MLDFRDETMSVRLAFRSGSWVKPSYGCGSARGFHPILHATATMLAQVLLAWSTYRRNPYG